MSPFVGIKAAAAGDMCRPVAEDMHWMVAECNPAVEEAAGQLVDRSARHLEPDSPSNTYIANRHCHIASGLPIWLQRPGHLPLRFP
jgi:hypothetical protein